METQLIHRGRLIDHIQIVTQDLAASRRFYEAVFAALGLELSGSGEDFFWVDELFVSSADSEAADGVPTGRTHLAFQAQDKAAVDRFYQAGLHAGATDHGTPGERPYHPGYYAAFLLDPDGNNIEAVYHGPATRSADSIEVRFEG